ncbi:MAG: transposase [bacterium]|nr:transposase [bacterium]
MQRCLLPVIIALRKFALKKCKTEKEVSWNIYYKKKKKSTKKIKVEFGEKNITPFGGMKLFNDFVVNLWLKRKLDESIEIQRRKSKYSIGKMLISIIYALVLDLTRLSDTILFPLDKVFLKILGFKEYPYDTTISRFLRKFTVPQALKIGEVNVGLLKEVRKSYKDKITLDLDSHVRTVYGSQRRASKGFNPKKKGRKSYHPNPLLHRGNKRFSIG